MIHNTDTDAGVFMATGRKSAGTLGKDSWYVDFLVTDTDVPIVCVSGF